MKKTLILISAIASLSINSFAQDSTNLENELELLKKKISKLEKKLKKVDKKANIAKAKSAGDNLKWNVDYRTQYDNITYKQANGTKIKNSSLLTNRLWLGMKYKADDNSIFYGTLSYNKIFGDNRADVTSQGGTPNNSGFDWVTNEAATNDNSLKVKEAYWLYTNDTFFGSDIAWTASLGRRPSTDGLGINLRADQKRKSALSHTVNVEFDGASFKFNLDKITDIEGSWFKICMGRGLTNSKLRFSNDGLDYTADTNTTSNVDMAGFIYVPYDNGQYSVHTNYAKAWNLLGNKTSDASGKFYEFGDMQFFTAMFKADGIGEEISDALDNTTFFASYAQSKTSPNKGEMMLGSDESKTGHSFWLGVNTPCPLSPDNAKIGIEWNKGSKYWRSMTYGEDTMVGSKIATRGTALEIYRNQQLTKALNFGLSYVKIKYDYTGSNGFFGDYGTPLDINSADAANAVKEAQDIKAYISYNF